MLIVDIDINLDILKDYNTNLHLLKDLQTDGNDISQSVQVGHSGTMDEFFQDYKKILNRHELEGHAGQILYLTAIIKEDIEITKEQLADVDEAIEILTFLVELLRLKEKSDEPINIDFKRKLPKGIATLSNQRLVDFTINSILKASKRPDFNTTLSHLLENVAYTRAGLTRVLLQSQYQYKDPTNFCLAKGCYNILVPTPY